MSTKKQKRKSSFKQQITAHILPKCVHISRSNYPTENIYEPLGRKGVVHRRDLPIGRDSKKNFLKRQVSHLITNVYGMPRLFATWLYKKWGASLQEELDQGSENFRALALDEMKQFNLIHESGSAHTAIVDDDYLQNSLGRIEKGEVTLDDAEISVDQEINSYYESDFSDWMVLISKKKGPARANHSSWTADSFEHVVYFGIDKESKAGKSSQNKSPKASTSADKSTISPKFPGEKQPKKDRTPQAKEKRNEFFLNQAKDDAKKVKQDDFQSVSWFFSRHHKEAELRELYYIATFDPLIQLIQLSCTGSTISGVMQEIWNDERQMGPFGNIYARFFGEVPFMVSQQAWNKLVHSTNGNIDTPVFVNGTEVSNPLWAILPRYGNWGGPHWSGGNTGDELPIDRQDAAYQMHDKMYSASSGLVNAPEMGVFSDKALVSVLNSIDDTNLSAYGKLFLSFAKAVFPKMEALRSMGLSISEPRVGVDRPVSRSKLETLESRMAPLYVIPDYLKEHIVDENIDNFETIGHIEAPTPLSQEQVATSATSDLDQYANQVQEMEIQPRQIIYGTRKLREIPKAGETVESFIARAISYPLSFVREGIYVKQGQRPVELGVIVTDIDPILPLRVFDKGNGGMEAKIEDKTAAVRGRPRFWEEVTSGATIDSAWAQGPSFFSSRNDLSAPQIGPDMREWTLDNMKVTPTRLLEMRGAAGYSPSVMYDIPIGAAGPEYGATFGHFATSALELRVDVAQMVMSEDYSVVGQKYRPSKEFAELHNAYTTVSDLTGLTTAINSTTSFDHAMGSKPIVQNTHPKLTLGVGTMTVPILLKLIIMRYSRTYSPVAFGTPFDPYRALPPDGGPVIQVQNAGPHASPFPYYRRVGDVCQVRTVFMTKNEYNAASLDMAGPRGWTAQSIQDWGPATWGVSTTVVFSRSAWNYEWQLPWIEAHLPYPCKTTMRSIEIANIELGTIDANRALFEDIFQYIAIPTGVVADQTVAALSVFKVLIVDCSSTTNTRFVVGGRGVQPVVIPRFDPTLVALQAGADLMPSLNGAITSQYQIPLEPWWEMYGDTTTWNYAWRVFCSIGFVSPPKWIMDDHDVVGMVQSNVIALDWTTRVYINYDQPCLHLGIMTTWGLPLNNIQRPAALIASLPSCDIVSRGAMAMYFMAESRVDFSLINPNPFAMFARRQVTSTALYCAMREESQRWGFPVNVMFGNRMVNQGTFEQWSAISRRVYRNLIDRMNGWWNQPHWGTATQNSYDHWGVMSGVWDDETQDGPTWSDYLIIACLDPINMVDVPKPFITAPVVYSRTTNSNQLVLRPADIKKNKKEWSTMSSVMANETWRFQYIDQTVSVKRTIANPFVRGVNNLHHDAKFSFTNNYVPEPTVFLIGTQVLDAQVTQVLMSYRLKEPSVCLAVASAGYPSTFLPLPQFGAEGDGYTPSF